MGTSEGIEETRNYRIEIMTNCDLSTLKKVVEYVDKIDSEIIDSVIVIIDADKDEEIDI